MKDRLQQYIVTCLKNNVLVYPVVYDLNHFKVEVDYNGRKKQTERKYNWKLEQKELQEKIKELYEAAGKRIQSRG
jgi:hypothetical protein